MKDSAMTPSMLRAAAALFLLATGACVRVTLPSTPDGGVTVPSFRVDTVRVEPDRSPYLSFTTAQDGPAVGAFAQDTLVITGTGWEPGAVQVRVGGRTLTSVVATASELRATIPVDLATGPVTLTSPGRRGGDGPTTVLHYLGPGHLLSPRFINQLEPAVVITNVRSPGPENPPAGVISAEFGFATQASQLGADRFLAAITVDNGASAISPVSGDITVAMPRGDYGVDLGGQRRPESDVSVVSLGRDAIHLHEEEPGDPAIAPPPGMLWTQLLHSVPSSPRQGTWGCTDWNGTTTCNVGETLAVAVDRALLVPDGGPPPPDAGPVPAMAIFQLTDIYGEPFGESVSDDTFLYSPITVASSSRPLAAAGVVPAGMDPVYTPLRDQVVTLRHALHVFPNSPNPDDEVLEIGRTGVEQAFTVNDPVRVNLWPRPRGMGCGDQNCQRRVECKQDPACEARLRCAHDPTCLAQFKCLFAPSSDPDDTTCLEVLGCDTPSGCWNQMACQNGQCGRARTCVEDSTCRTMFESWKECLVEYTEDFCNYYWPCSADGSCSEAMLCHQERGCAFALECVGNPACAPALDDNRYDGDSVIACELDPQCAAEAACVLEGSQCCWSMACFDALAALPPDSTPAILPLAPGKALVDLPGQVCVLDLDNNRIQGLPVHTSASTALLDRDAQQARLLWVPGARSGGSQCPGDVASASASAQQVWSLRPYAPGTALAVADARVPYSQLVSDSLLKRVYAVPRTGAQIDVLDEDARRQSSINVLGVPLSVLPLDTYRGDRFESLMLFLYSGMAVLTDATGARKSTNVLRVDTNAEGDSGTRYFEETPGRGLRRIWYALTKPSVGRTTRISTVDLERDTGTLTPLQPYVDLQRVPLTDPDYSLDLTAAVAAVTERALLLVMTTMETSELASTPCAEATNVCARYDALACHWLAYIPRAADGSPIHAAGSATVAPTFVPGSCRATPDLDLDLSAAAELDWFPTLATGDPVAQRAYIHATQWSEDNTPLREMMVVDLSGSAPVLVPNSDHQIPHGTPLVPMPAGGVVGSFQVNGSTQSTLGVVDSRGNFTDTGLVVGSGVGMAVSPDERRIYVGGDGAIMEVTWAPDPLDPSVNRAAIVSIIPVLGAPSRIHTDLKGERLIYLDDAKRLVGLLK
jgi:hypothetical protein